MVPQHHFYLPVMSKVATGLEVFREGRWKEFKGCRLGLLSNQASVDGNLTPARDVISTLLPGDMKVLFGPQHGYRGEEQDNMVETNHSVDTDLQIPVYSLYGKYREPLPEMLDLLDVLIVDLQDVGTRVYTFAATMLHCLKKAATTGKKVVILDRPNPIGGEIVEGNLLKPELYSFVGPYSLPMRHGLTMGEMAKIFNHGLHIESDLDIIPMRGWSRNMVWKDTGLRWIMPSPNMPLDATAHVYPGQVLWEGTNISEGRGTCRPFEILGAPFLNTNRIKKSLVPRASQGCHLQDIAYRPTFHKWKGEICRGFMIHILDYSKYRPFFTSLALLKAIMETHRQYFRWKEPPYEYEYEKMPFDLILGNSEWRRAMEKGEYVLDEDYWLPELKNYDEWRKAYLLYG